MHNPEPFGIIIAWVDNSIPNGYAVTMTDVDVSTLKEVMRSLAQRKRTITPELKEANRQRSIAFWQSPKGKAKRKPAK